VEEAYGIKLAFQVIENQLRQDGDAIFFSFAVANKDFMPFKTNVFDPECPAFAVPQPAAVHQENRYS
jgi:hypothetical protein